MTEALTTITLPAWDRGSRETPTEAHSNKKGFRKIINCKERLKIPVFLILPTMTVVFNVLYTASGFRKLATHLIAWMLRIALSLFQYSPMMLIFTFLRFKAKI